MQAHRGTLILILGIVGLIVCPITGIMAFFMGSGDLKKMAAGTMDPEGKQLTNIGKILGIISIVFLAIGVILAVVAVIGGIGAGGMAAMEAAEASQEAGAASTAQ